MRGHLKGKGSRKRGNKKDKTKKAKKEAKRLPTEKKKEAGSLSEKWGLGWIQEVNKSPEGKSVTGRKAEMKTKGKYSINKRGGREEKGAGGPIEGTLQKKRKEKEDHQGRSPKSEPQRETTFRKGERTVKGVHNRPRDQPNQGETSWDKGRPEKVK